MSYDIKTRLRELGLKQVDFLRVVEQLSGAAPSPVSLTRWVKGQHPVPPLAVACVELLALLPDERRAELVKAASIV